MNLTKQSEPASTNDARRYRLGRWLTSIAALAVVTFGLCWWIGSYRDPVEITYCLNRVNSATLQFKCLEAKTLKIPRAYDGDGYQFNFSNRTANDFQYLEVAYPSMKPWQSVPWSDRKNTTKIKLQLRGISNRHLVGENMESFFLGSPTAIQRVQPLHGLDLFDKDGSLILLSSESIRRVGIVCTHGSYPENSEVGYCWTYGHTNWGLNLYLGSNHAVLPQWQEVNTKTVALVNSFVVNP